MSKLDNIIEQLEWSTGALTVVGEDMCHLVRIATAAKELQEELDLIWTKEHPLDNSPLNRSRHLLRTALEE
jgi:hypothetical protein